MGALSFVGCGGEDGGSTSTVSTGDTTTTGGTTTGGTGSSSTSCVLIPEETQGPYPLFSSAVSNSALWRQDITEGLTGVPLTLLLTLVDVNNDCAPLSNVDVYVWHCDKDGNYSGYGSYQSETFMRGVQTTDSSGQVTFATIYPGWYTGRITHIHFRVFLGSSLEATSQLAFPLDVTAAVYNSTLYAARGQNTSVTSFSADNVFSDGTTYQLCTMSGSVAAGYTAALTVGVAL